MNMQHTHELQALSIATGQPAPPEALAGHVSPHLVFKVEAHHVLSVCANPSLQTSGTRQAL